MITFYEFRGRRYPGYLRQKNATSYIAPFATRYCQGKGLDVGAGKYPLPGAVGIDPHRGRDRTRGYHAMNLPGGSYDYIYSSHCLEHLTDPSKALEYWHSLIRPGGTLFLYLPHPDNEEWLPEHTRGHLNIWRPEEAAELVAKAGFSEVIHSERDLLWSFAVVGFKT